MEVISSVERKVVSAKKASMELMGKNRREKDKALRIYAKLLMKNKKEILKENKKDVDNAIKKKLNASLVKRLELDSQKISDIKKMVLSVAKLDDPIGKTLYSVKMDDGFELYKVSFPIGVIGIIFEARPEALSQISSLALKSGNSVILKGGSEAQNSNRILAKLFREALKKARLPMDCVVLLEGREQVLEMLRFDRHIDLIIPRGSYELVRFIQNNTAIPVLGHDSGLCTVYVDKDGDLNKAVKICLDSKTNYPAACNAIEKILVHERIAKKFLQKMIPKFKKQGVEVRADEKLYNIAEKLGFEITKAKDKDFETEFLDLIVAIKSVKSADEAIEEINNKGSHHTDAIITKNKKTAHEFLEKVDSACVFWNASTRFSDGYRFGLGAEVGISNKKVHARGPVGLEGLTTCKWILEGKGQIVETYIGKKGRKFRHGKLNKPFKM